MLKHKVKSALKALWKDFRFNLSATDHPVFNLYYKYLYKPQKGSLSEFLSAYSRSKKGDFWVIQIGANDGITHDPIHKFIKRDQWKGVLLEPQPDVFRNELRKIYQHNKGITPICAAIGNEDGVQNLYKIGFSTMRWATGLASFSKEKIDQLFVEGIVQKNCQKYGIEIPSDPDQQITSEEVQVICPKTLLETYAITQIDLLQIDAEGYDLEVIRIFDIPKTKPNAIIFENENLNPSDLEECYELLESEDYLLRKFGRDTLALKKNLNQLNEFFD
ncbi:FkbM family methyltransferase [Algoriphagus sp. C2-6-M1]|uniref:FkbM family methyltransferase n=1 Tax=Algoriphagus persicinus TaxID=3108754 RepID=UPI002B3ECD4C|nr:FkbM family methyltransferase [Algoriphagus sp. C2-6-M1]MEB2782748.1 FkbM family methyltransferase [Algoriphagus sp. C2-6-M1]